MRKLLADSVARWSRQLWLECDDREQSFRIFPMDLAVNKWYLQHLRTSSPEERIERSIVPQQRQSEEASGMHSVTIKI